MDNLKEYRDLIESTKKEFNPDNFYVHEMMSFDDYILDDNGSLRKIHKTEEKRIEEAVSLLLDDKDGYFAEFILETELREKVIEFIRAILKKEFIYEKSI